MNSTRVVTPHRDPASGQPRLGPVCIQTHRFGFHFSETEVPAVAAVIDDFLSPSLESSCFLLHDLVVPQCDRITVTPAARCAEVNACTAETNGSVNKGLLSKNSKR